MRERIDHPASAAAPQKRGAAPVSRRGDFRSGLVDGSLSEPQKAEENQTDHYFT
jgi:hypothetical protein